MDNKECLELLVKFYLSLAKSLGMVDPNGNIWSNILTKRQNLIEKLDGIIASNGEEIKDLQGQLLDLDPSSKGFKKAFVELQQKLVIVQQFNIKAISTKTKLESTIHNLVIKCASVNKFMNYTWSTTDRGSGVKKGYRNSEDPQVKLRDLLLTVLDLIDDIAVENDTNFLAQCQHVDTKEIAWAFASALDYHCHQKSSDAGLKAKLNMSTKEVYAMYKKPIEMLFKVCNSYDKPCED